MRTAVIIAIALAALAADLLAAARLFAAATGADALLAPDSTYVFLHLSAVLVGVAAFSACGSTPTGRDRLARAFFYGTLSLPLPGIGLALVALLAFVIALTKQQKSTAALFRVGNPYADPVTGALSEATDPAASRSAEPLTSRVRGSDLTDLRTLAIGLRGLPIERTAPVLERLQKDPDTYLQLYAQGDAAEAAEIAEIRLRTLAQNTRNHPDDHAARLAFAAHLLYLAAAPAVAIDQRSNHLGRALEQIESITSPVAHALRTAIHTLDSNAAEAADALNKLRAADPEYQSVSKVETAVLRANLLHLERNWAGLATELSTPELAADPRYAQVQLFFAGAH